MIEGALPPIAPPREANPGGRIVWLASFPKSGNTWTRILLANFLGELEQPEETDDPIAAVGQISSDRSAFDNITGICSGDLTVAETDLLRPLVYRECARSTPRAHFFVKVHDAWQRNRAGEGLFPADCSRGAILLVRHPMDVCLSFAFHRGQADCTQTAHHMSRPNFSIGRRSHAQIPQQTLGWSGHYLSWTRQTEIPLLVVRYEDLLADTVTVFARMLTFLKIEGADDRERVARAVELSRFDRLREREDRAGFRETAPTAERFFRSGRSGEGIESLPAELRDKLWHDHAAVMEELGYSKSGVIRL
ncbi:sulfotransferase domain-containing protein [Sphingomonas canadensis]|uniref:Sulfotransferase domain-containing protein n=1 Tax=Sphingomonas canadensis TaxID=1219257 RepID=A0ABW3H8Z7_9SPHN|nr:sulfotransferase domain-containing protein [Sphingomonas canadensis]MCW3837668.1 sulfotransferase domain-containing protein [Sphingomonas canadensis]